jgi:predicted AAA+ superfamily ATPase
MRPLTLPERLDLAPTVSMQALLRGDAAVRGRCELTLADYVGEITAGGFPGLRALTPRARERQLDSYIDRIIDHDLPELGHAVRRPEIVRSWLRAYGAATASTASFEAIRNAATSGVSDKPARTTTGPYIAFLERLRILDPLEAWLPTANHFTTLSSGPKHYLADPALATRLLRMSASRLLAGETPDVVIPRDGSFLGAAFEALVGLSVRTFAQRNDARAYHLRTHAGRHEVDFVVETADGVVAIEAKLSGTVDSNDVRHLLWLRNQRAVDCIDTVIVNTGREAYRRKDGVAVIPLALLGP